MLPTIKSRLIAAFGAIVALLALTTLVADRQITATTRTTEELVGPYWSTADHLMEASIRIRERSRTVLNPGFELDRKAFERTYEDELQKLAAGFGGTSLPPATVGEIHKAAADPDRVLVVEVSPRYPRTHGLGEHEHRIHVDRIDVLIETDREPFVIGDPEPTAEERAIAEFVAVPAEQPYDDWDELVDGIVAACVHLLKGT